jgi:serine O-acetyltransferase
MSQMKKINTGEAEAVGGVGLGLWHRLRQEAEAICAAEPIFLETIKRDVLRHASLGEALGCKLAHWLGNAEISADVLCAEFQQIVLADIDIARNAEADLAAILERDPACHRAIDPFLFFKGWHAVQAYRFAHHLWMRGRKDLAYYIQSRISLASSMDIHPAARIGRGIMVDHGHDVVIGETCVIEDNVSLMQGVTLGGNGKEIGDRQPKIREGVLIGAGAKVLGNIEIGRGSRIAAGSVVLHAVPPYTTVAGVPAKVVGGSGSPAPARSMDHSIEAEDKQG